MRLAALGNGAVAAMFVSGAFVNAADAALELGAENASGSWAGTAARSAVGATVSGVGDVNGDGFEDFAVTNGADFYYANSEEVGRGWVVFGSDDPPGTHADINLASDASFQRDFLGYVVRAGDINADGIDDLLFADGAQSPTVFLLYGSANPPWGHGSALASVANASFRYGDALAGNVDFNGDGKDDFALVDYSAAMGIYGTTNPTWTLNTSAAAAYSMRLSAPGGALSVGVGDFNGDGYADMFSSDVSSFGTNWRFLFGKSQVPNTGGSDYYFSVPSVSGLFASGSGDFDGDGFDDALHNGWSSEKCTLLWGRSASLDGPPLPESAAWTTSVAGVDLARSTEWLGDVNGDGCDDFATWQRGSYEDQFFSAEDYAWVVLGSHTRPTGSNQIGASATMRLGPFQGSGNNGQNISATDWNGDGLMDILIGAGGEENGDVENAGRVFIYLAGDYPAATWFNHLRRTSAGGGSIADFGPARAFMIVNGSSGPYQCRVAYKDRAPDALPGALHRTWQTDPGAAPSYTLALLYTDGQVAETGGDESKFILMAASAEDGPWTPTPFAFDADGNFVAVDAPQTGVRWWAIAPAGDEAWIIE